MLTEDRAARLVAETVAGASLGDAARAAGVSARSLRRYPQRTVSAFSARTRVCVTIKAGPSDRKRTLRRPNLGEGRLHVKQEVLIVAERIVGRERHRERRTLNGH